MLTNCKISRLCLIIPILLSVLSSQGISSDHISTAIYLKGEQLAESIRRLDLLDSAAGIKLAPYEYNSYYKYNLDNDKLIKVTKLLYLNNVASSPNGKWAVEYILFKDNNDNWDTKYKLYSVANPSFVIDLGRILKYAWSQQGDRIAYITSDPLCKTIDCPPDKWINEIVIYDTKDQSKKVIKKPAKALTWPSFDNNIYFNLADKWDDPKIFRYHPDSGKIDSTPYEGLNFSPNGKYYIVDHYADGDPARFYLREPHHHLLEIEQDLTNRANLYASVNWLSDSHSIFLSDRYSLTKFIVYDLDKRSIKQTIEGAFLGFDRSRSKGLFMKGVDQFEVVDLLGPSSIRIP